MKYIVFRSTLGASYDMFMGMDGQLYTSFENASRFPDNIAATCVDEWNRTNDAYGVWFATSLYTQVGNKYMPEPGHIFICRENPGHTFVYLDLDEAMSDDDKYVYGDNEIIVAGVNELGETWYFDDLDTLIKTGTIKNV